MALHLLVWLGKSHGGTVPWLALLLTYWAHAVVWTGAQFWWITHAKLPYVEISHTDSPAGPSS